MRRAHITPYRLEVGCPSPKSRRDYFTGSLSFIVISHCLPSYLADKFILINTDITIRSSDRLPDRSLFFRTPCTEALKSSFIIIASYLINFLLPFFPFFLNSFKTSLFYFLLERDRTVDFGFFRRVLLISINLLCKLVRPLVSPLLPSVPSIILYFCFVFCCVRSALPCATYSLVITSLSCISSFKFLF